MTFSYSEYVFVMQCFLKVITVHAYNGNNDNIKYKIANPTDSPDHHGK